MRITEIATQKMTRWVSGDIRFTPKEKELLTNQARVIIAGKDTASQCPFPARHGLCSP